MNGALDNMAKNIKAKLQQELAKKDPDYEAISILTSKLLDENEDAVRFSVDAFHINRLGLELVGKQETALSELIKNSYDADARLVSIEFRNHDEAGGQLVIQDDGVGMDALTIKSSWMRLSTDAKIKSPISTRYGRKRAGKKGIGRFAVQRLGKELILETEIKGEKTGIRVRFDWDQKFKSGTDIGTIWNEIEYYKKEEKSHGTRLIINTLRDKWKENVIERVWKSVLLLQPPHKIATSKNKKTYEGKKYRADPGFRVIINGITSEEQENKFSIKNSFLNQSAAIITGTIDDKGRAKFRVVSKKLNLDETHKSDNIYSLAGKTKLQTSYFIYSPELMTGISVKAAAEMGHKYGGMRVYRDGFRVLPYGEQQDDWLLLAYDTGRRNLLVPANNQNFFGHLEVNEEDNPLLNETSSREGFIENEAFFELRDFSRECLEWAALKVAWARDRKQTASQKGFKSKKRKEKKTTVQEIIEDLDKQLSFFSDRGQDKKSHEAFKEVKEAFEDVKEKIITFGKEKEDEKEESLKYESMLRILASLGISLSIFSHEIKGAFDGVHTNIALLRKAIPDIKPNDIQKKIGERSTNVSKLIDKVFDLGGYISKLISRTNSRALKNVSLTNVIDGFSNQFGDYMQNYGIKFSVKVDPPGLRTCKIHRSEIDSVLFNFLTNAIKSLEASKQKERKINIEAYEEKGDVVLKFEDNGGGVDVGIQDKIFDAFFTTADQNKDEIAGIGTGLGLKIVSDIASSYGGNVRLAKATKNYNCCFEFRIPSSTKKA